MKISELISEAVGLTPDPNVGEKSRYKILTNPKDIAAADAASATAADARLAAVGARSKLRTAQQPAAIQQQAAAAASPLAAKDKNNVTDVTAKVPGQAVNTTQQAQAATQAAAAQQTKTIRPMGSAATLGAPVAAQAAAKPGGFLSGVAQGFKRGMGMDPEQGIAANLAQSGLSKLGMTGAARALDTPRGITDISYLKPGQMINDPISGKGTVKVMSNPGGKGVKLDTTKTLGYPIVVDPKDIK